MLRVVKSELLKIFSGKMIYICIAILFSLPFIEYISYLGVHDMEPSLLDAITSLSRQEYITNSIINLVSSMNFALIFIISILVSSLITEDYGNGTMKYSILAVTKEKLMIGKIITTGIINLIYLLVILASHIIISLLACKWSPEGIAISQIIGAFLLSWITLYGYACLITFALNKISKVSGAIGMGLGIYAIIAMLNGLLSNSYKFLVITGNSYKLMDMTVKSWVEVGLTGLIYIVTFSILSIVIFRKKEILC